MTTGRINQVARDEAATNDAAGAATNGSSSHAPSPRPRPAFGTGPGTARGETAPHAPRAERNSPEVRSHSARRTRRYARRPNSPTRLDAATRADEETLTTYPRPSTNASAKAHAHRARAAHRATTQREITNAQPRKRIPTRDDSQTPHATAPYRRDAATRHTHAREETPPIDRSSGRHTQHSHVEWPHRTSRAACRAKHTEKDTHRETIPSSS